MQKHQVLITAKFRTNKRQGRGKRIKGRRKL
jgi:hypothetical protein